MKRRRQPKNANLAGLEVVDYTQTIKNNSNLLNIKKNF